MPPLAGGGATTKYHYQKQPIATLTQVPAVQNTWYTILDTTEDARLIFIVVRQTSDEMLGEDIEVRLTIDGVTLVGSRAPATAGTYYHVFMDWDADTLEVQTSDYNTAIYIDIRGQSVKIEMRITSVVGTNQTLYGYVQYEQLEAT